MNGKFSFRRIDPYSLVMDILRNLWVAVLGAAAVTMLLTMYLTVRHESNYTTSATFVVMSKESSNNVYYNLNAASTMASTFSSVINSDALKEKVCTQLNLDSFDATVSSSIMGDTNILELYVTANSPQLAYNIINSIIEQYPSLTQFVSDSMVMSVIKEPDVPMYANNPLYIRGSQQNWFIRIFLVLVIFIGYLSIRQDTIKSRDDLKEKLDAKDLGVVYHEKKKFRLRNRATTSLLVSNLGASFSFVEEYRKITAHITQSMSEGQKIILVTSVREHEGKSTSAANIALTLAKSGKSVVLIDGDLRRPSLANLFKIKLEKGHSLTSVFDNTMTMNDYITHYEGLDLALFLCDQGYNNSTEILSSAKMKKLIDWVRDAADYVVIDSPPINSLADAQVLAGYADVSVLVVQYNREKAEVINDTIDVLKEYHAEFAGVILNGVRTLRVPMVGYGKYGRYGYGKYGYGRYGRYGTYGKYAHYAQEKTDVSEEDNNE